MTKIRSMADLKRFQEQFKAEREARNGEKIIVSVSLATCSIAAGGNRVMEAMKDEVARQEIHNVRFVRVGCMTYCHSEPTVEVSLPGREPVVFGRLDEEGARRLVRSYLRQGELTDTVIPVTAERCEL